MMNKKNKIRGDSVITFPLVITIATIGISMFIVFIINIIMPFIWYQKLQLIAHKYMYVIERYGYLTNSEKDSMIAELERANFDIDNITFSIPNEVISYGNVIEFEISYIYKQKIPTWKGTIKMQEINIPINVRKVSISKK